MRLTSKIEKYAGQQKSEIKDLINDNLNPINNKFFDVSIITTTVMAFLDEINIQNLRM